MLHRPRIKFKERALRITTIRPKCEKLNQQHNKKELMRTDVVLFAGYDAAGGLVCGEDQDFGYLHVLGG